MKRQRLPNRRDGVTVDLIHDGNQYAVTLGFDPVGRVGEVFAAAGTKAGSTMDGILSDGCILISILLQHGIAPDALALSLGRLGGSRGRASILGAVADVIASETTL